MAHGSCGVGSASGIQKLRVVLQWACVSHCERAGCPARPTTAVSQPPPHPPTNPFPPALPPPQVLLYLLLMEERYGTPLQWGMLWYTGQPGALPTGRGGEACAKARAVAEQGLRSLNGVGRRVAVLQGLAWHVPVALSACQRPRRRLVPCCRPSAGGQAPHGPGLPHGGAQPPGGGHRAPGDADADW